MRGNENVTAIASIQGLNLELRFGDHTINVSACVVGKELKILCDEFPIQNWISEHKKEVLAIVAEELPSVRRLQIYANTFK